MADYCLIAGVGCAAFSGFFYAVCKNKNDLVRSIQSAVQVEFGPELTSSLKACPENTLPYAAIIGDAKPKRPSDFLTSDNVPDLQSLVKKIHVYELKSEWSDSLRRWEDVKTLVNSAIQSVPFKLWSSKGSAQVSEPLSANYFDLQNVFDKFEPVAHNTAQTIFHWAAGEKTKGFQTVEKVLPVGTTLLGIGKLSLTKDGMVLSPPSNGKPYFLSTLSMEGLLREVQTNKGLWKALSVLFACGSGILFCIALYKYYKQRRLKAENERFLRGMQEESREGNAENVIGEPCVICLENQRDIVILECGHICICHVCAEQISECPVCRGAITRLVSTYRS